MRNAKLMNHPKKVNGQYVEKELPEVKIDDDFMVQKLKDYNAQADALLEKCLSYLEKQERMAGTKKVLTALSRAPKEIDASPKAKELLKKQSRL